MFFDWSLGERDKQADSTEIHVDSTKIHGCSIERKPWGFHKNWWEFHKNSWVLHTTSWRFVRIWCEIHRNLWWTSFFSFQEVSAEKILKQEHEWVKLAYQKWNKNKNLYVLGQSSADRLPIFAIVVTHPETNKFIHHNFISALLNDMLGIQARGGCACAGPYAEVYRYVLFIIVTTILVKLWIPIFKISYQGQSYFWNK